MKMLENVTLSAATRMICASAPSGRNKTGNAEDASVTPKILETKL